jgi:hypothetical protein
MLTCGLFPYRDASEFCVVEKAMLNVTVYFELYEWSIIPRGSVNWVAGDAITQDRECIRRILEGKAFHFGIWGSIEI